MRFRYPGPDSFADSAFDSQMFFGRAEEIANLANQVAGLRLVVLYGKSGLGKTSLLQAGLFPKLRGMNFFPVRVRPADIEDGLAGAVLQQLQARSGEYGYALSVDPSDSLLELMDSTVISRGEVFQVPVLVLDQFEEVFNLYDAERREALMRQVQQLLFPPGHGAAPDVRVVLSFREEFLGALEEFSELLPGVLAHRVRLGPLGREQAREAIEGPARAEVSQKTTHAFEFEPGVVDQMLDYLSDARGNAEPIELQILCQHIEREMSRLEDAGQVIEPVRLEDFFPEGMQAALEDFYLQTMRSYPWRLRRKLRRFCEYGLVTGEGYRDSIRQMRVQDGWGINSDTLDDLVDKRLLRREDRLNDIWYELTHDRLAEAVSASRATGRYYLGLKIVGEVVAVATLVLIGWAYLAVQIDGRHAELAAAAGNMLADVPEPGAGEQGGAVIEPGSPAPPPGESPGSAPAEVQEAE